MKRDVLGRPVCIGLGPSRPCGIALHPGYTICYNCKRPYTGEESRWADEEIKKQLQRIVPQS